MAAPEVDSEHEEISEDGRNYHPKQAASDVVSEPSSGKGFLVEMFVGEETSDYDRVANWAINEILQYVDSTDEIGVLYTGLNESFTEALEYAVDNRGVETVVEPCYPDISKYVEAGVEEYDLSETELFSKRNRQLARNHVDVAVAVTDEDEEGAGSNLFTRRLESLGVETLTVDVTVGL